MTYGARIVDRTIDSYPAQLGQMLQQYSNQWEVRNFGVNSATVLSKGDVPYVQQSVCTEALQWQPEIVIIMLGTNDSKPQNWVYKEEYVPNYLELIDSFAGLASHPRIWICKPVPAFQLRWGINDDVIRDEVGPMIEKIASLRDVRVVDLYTPMLGASSHYADYIHPDATGAGLMAEVLLPLLTGIQLQAVHEDTRPPYLLEHCRIVKSDIHVD
ncbi:GDSL-type esterase/lipase family protein [Planctomycetota bacterium]